VQRVYHLAFGPPEDVAHDLALSNKIELCRRLPDAFWLGRGNERGGGPASPQQQPPELDAAMCDEVSEALYELNGHRSPMGKLDLVLKACRRAATLCGRGRSAGREEEVIGADELLPVLTLLVVRSSPPQLWSNLQFVARFSPARSLLGEAGYCLVSMLSAISFIESVDVEKALAQSASPPPAPAPPPSTAPSSSLT
jgi:hypothetical protein